MGYRDTREVVAGPFVQLKSWMICNYTKSSWDLCLGEGIELRLQKAGLRGRR